MADVVVMPQLGNTVESCLVTAWHVGVGDSIDANTVVASIETDKSSMEIPAGVAGTVLALLAGEGDEVAVKEPFIIVGAPGEDVAGLAGVAPSAVAAAPVGDVAATHDPVVPEVPHGGQLPESSLGEQAPLDIGSSTIAPVYGAGAISAVSPRARRMAHEAGIDAARLAGSGPHGRVTTTDVQAAIAGKGMYIPSPAALAQTTGVSEQAAQPPVPPALPEQSVQTPVPSALVPSLPTQGYTQAAGVLAHLTGTGLGGRLTRDDIARLSGIGTSVPLAPQGSAANAATPTAPSAVPPSATPAPTLATPVPAPLPQLAAQQQPAPAQPAPAIMSVQGPYKQTPLKGIRKLVAERMLASLANHAQLTFNSSAPAAGLQAARARFKDSSDMAGVTIGDMVAYAAAQVAIKHAALNATLSDKVLTTYEQVHLGFAVDTPRGLLVPTVVGASQMRLREFSEKSKELAAQAKVGNINPDLLSGATFTVTNLGAYGIESFTPILNSPQVAILGVDAITPRPVINADGSLGVEQRISLSLTVDHAVVDGADAARYLKDLVAYIANIDKEVA
ncbi:MAG: 2-oxo acid dehydrogenase subunit E2 [Propionibacteriaceae bacterium]|jgi:pyruvate dehydrogenase E2 component (dihydrolipoamide acetyltransferase)|nr:2-oxo acid dehydrogenase subunit E2 [Propionibacteriaceae bacterium]